MKLTDTQQKYFEALGVITYVAERYATLKDANKTLPFLLNNRSIVEYEAKCLEIINTRQVDDGFMDPTNPAYIDFMQAVDYTYQHKSEVDDHAKFTAEAKCALYHAHSHQRAKELG